jgi:hypothetical protein
MKFHYEIPGSLKRKLTVDFDSGYTNAEVVYRDQMGRTTKWNIPKEGSVKVSSWYNESGMRGNSASEWAGSVSELLPGLQADWSPVSTEWYKRLQDALFG